ncbi:E3 ubiquitin- ligase FANCL [Brachionus plicatilis]|uniref:E3 ubiquitin-ligase FANCL n=1 Tax=Brachionus plicatilis TaxID=10195 RepID=A0A3M7QS23_BRAPC|nr:E3 ubiquitin- ligase FANCL [Brachionus plicatilis]
MNSNFNPVPNLIPVLDESSGNKSTFIYKGFIDIFQENFYINLKVNFDDKKIDLLKIECDCHLNNLIFAIKPIIEQRLAKCDSISNYLHELKNLIEFNLKKCCDNFSNIDYLYSIDFYKNVVKQIESIGWRNLLKANSSFTELVFVYEENGRLHELGILLSDLFPNKEPHFRTDLPGKFTFDWNQSSSLAEVYANFMNEVNSYSLFWDEMKMIDERCWVLEPLRPSKTDCRRRIKLDSNVSLDIKVDARNATELPEMLFLGSEAATEAFRHKLESKYDEWNANISVVYNLGELLEIQLPSKCEQEEVDIWLISVSSYVMRIS